MKLPLSWIGVFASVENPLATHGAKELAHIYSTHTSEIEGYEAFGDYDKVVVGRVISTERHPESTKLWITKVDLGKHGEETILTGAQNIPDAKYVPVAMVGAALSPDFVITERKMAGMISRGMICGADEIGLSKQVSTGIMILEEFFEESILAKQLGENLFDLEVAIPDIAGGSKMIKISGTGFEIDNKSVTNRPDLFGILGHAREFATLFDLEFTAPKYPLEALPAGNLPTEVLSKNVLSYHLMKIEGVTPKPSPLGISLMLEQSGHQTRLDLVDITNYLMTELGQPMHVFDADKVDGHIIVRQAQKGETLVALDGKTYTFESSDLVIADQKKVLAIAGVMGGMDSGVTESTQNIYFESAVFDPTAIRLTAQRLAIRTDASTRYEKSLDPMMSKQALARAIQLMTFLGQKSTISGTSYYLDETRVKKIELTVAVEFIRNKL